MYLGVWLLVCLIIFLVEAKVAVAKEWGNRVCLFGVFTLHGTSGYSATGPTALRGFRTTSRVNFYHQKYTPSDPSMEGEIEW